MMILFNPKIRITLSILTGLLLSLTFKYLYNNPQNQARQNSSINQQKSFIQSELQMSDFSNPIISQQIQNIPSNQYPVIDEWQKLKFNINSNQIFSSGKLPSTKVNFNQVDLLNVLINTRKYFQDYGVQDPAISRTGILGTQGVTLPDILKTLDFMITVLTEDIANHRITRLQNSDFINANFRVIKWSAYNSEKSQQSKLRITKYAVFKHPGSRIKTPKFNIPIYSLKDNYGNDKFYQRYTKQDILSGIYEPGGKEFGKVETLAYLTREGLEAALMEGTVLINFTDGSQRFFNVDRNNGMSYIRKLAQTAQKRYWYFRPVDAIKGYGYKIDAKISIQPGVTFAGDVLNIGLGKIVVIESTEGGRKNLRMGVIADTGGAFLPNLHQLDFLAGIFQNQQDFQKHIQQLPEYANAYILIKRE